MSIKIFYLNFIKSFFYKKESNYKYTKLKQFHMGIVIKKWNMKLLGNG